jgi:Flp pilus assembly protein TadG
MTEQAYSRNLARRLLRAMDGHTKKAGQAVFEFVIMLRIFIAFILLAVDFGVWMYAQSSVANGAREGARYAAILCGASTCDATGISALKQRVRDRSGHMVDDPTEVDVWWRDRNIDFPPANTPGMPLPGKSDSVLVRVTHPHQLLFVPGNPTIEIASCAEMRLEENDLTSAIPLGTADPHLDC